jgi:hypothetical protein
MKTLKQVRSEFLWLDPALWRQHENGKGWIHGDAKADLTAHIEGVVSGNAWVSGNAQVSGNAWKISPLYIQGTRHAVTHCQHGFLQIGCEKRSIANWLENHIKIDAANGYLRQQIREYELYIKLGAARDAEITQNASETSS